MRVVALMQVYLIRHICIYVLQVRLQVKKYVFLLLLGPWYIDGYDIQ